MRSHINAVKAGRPDKNTIKQRVIKKILDNGELPILKKIIQGADRELACLIETEFISLYGRKDIDTGCLTNMTSGGDGGTGYSKEVQTRQLQALLHYVRNIRIVDEEYAKKISDGMKEHHKNFPMSQERKDHLSEIMSGENNPFYGKTHTLEVRAHLSEVNTGKIVSQETKDRQSAVTKGKRSGENNGNYGHTRSQDAIDRASKGVKEHNLQNKLNGIPHHNAGKKHKKLECEFCGKYAAPGPFKLFHSDNCKLNPNKK